MVAAYVHAGTIEQAHAVGARIRAGQVYLSGDMDLLDTTVPFGGLRCTEIGANGAQATSMSCLIGYLKVKQTFFRFSMEDVPL
jgi:aldehyde dehydrogenase (NAD+)